MDSEPVDPPPVTTKALGWWVWVLAPKSKSNDSLCTFLTQNAFQLDLHRLGLIEIDLD
jgi:hypothetical protein